MTKGSRVGGHSEGNTRSGTLEETRQDKTRRDKKRREGGWKVETDQSVSLWLARSVARSFYAGMSRFFCLMRRFVLAEREGFAGTTTTRERCGTRLVLVFVFIGLAFVLFCRRR